MVRNRRRKSKGKSIFITIVVLGLLVFLGADNFGFDWFNFKIDLNKSATKTESPNTNKDQSDTGSQYINIVVKDDSVTLNDQLIDLTELEKQLENFDFNHTTINLMDNGAYNSTFTEIENLLSVKGYKVIISDIK